MKCFVYRKDSRDNIGRPLMFFILKNLKLRNIEMDHLLRFVCYSMDMAGANMPTNVD